MGNCKHCMSEEFSAESMSLNYFNPSTFVTSLPYVSIILKLITKKYVLVSCHYNIACSKRDLN